MGAVVLALVLTTGAAGLVFVVLLGNWLVRQVPGLPWPLVAYGRQIPFTSIDGVQPLYIGEGLHSSVGVTETAQGVRSFHVAGKTEASTSDPSEPTITPVRPRRHPRLTSVDRCRCAA